MMKRIKFRILPALAAAALALSACESANKVAAPAAANDGFHTVSGPPRAIVKAPGAFMPQDDGAWRNSAVIGAAGGTLNIGPHHLTVPAGVVPDGTVFDIAISRSNIFQVDLNATSAGAPAKSNDVGGAGFNGSVYLALDYGAPAAPGFTIAWVTSSGLLPVATQIDGNFVVGRLNHFSIYVLAEMISEYVLGEK